MAWAFQCPFWKGGGRGKESSSICEGCRLEFAAVEEQSAYFSRYCANDTGWRDCTVARNLSISYERGLRQ